MKGKCYVILFITMVFSIHQVHSQKSDIAALKKKLNTIQAVETVFIFNPDSAIGFVMRVKRAIK